MPKLLIPRPIPTILMTMILEALRFCRRQKRYREVSSLIITILTRFELERLDRTLTDQYDKAMASGKMTPEEVVKQFNSVIMEQSHTFCSKSLGRRVKQWTDAILEQEDL